MVRDSKFVALCLAVAVLALNVADSLGSLPSDISTLNRTIEEAHADGQRWVKTPIGVANSLFGLKAVVWPKNEAEKPERGKLPTYTIVYQKPSSKFESSQGWFHVTAKKKENGTWGILKVAPCADDKIKTAKLKLDERRTRLGPPGFDFLTQGPLEFLELLRLRPHGMVSTMSMPYGWLQDSDIPALIELLYFTEPCAVVCAAFSSNIPKPGSTIGNEAAFLIMGFRRGFYPPTLHSKFGPLEKEEILQWWKERNGT